MADRTCFEDLSVGKRFGGASYEVDEQEMIEFARKWDPRPIHVDARAGRAAGFGGLIASGAYTTAIFTLLGQQSREADGEHAVIAGLGADSRMVAPVRAGQMLRYEAEIVGARESSTRPDAGIVRTRARLLNQLEEVVYEATTVTLVARRRPSRAEADARS